MTLEQARRTLKEGGDLPRLADAIGVIASDRTTSDEDLKLGLRFEGFVAEQAALALYKRKHVPLPKDRTRLVEEALALVRNSDASSGITGHEVATPASEVSGGSGRRRPSASSRRRR